MPAGRVRGKFQQTLHRKSLVTRLPRAALKSEEIEVRRVEIRNPKSENRKKSEARNPKSLLLGQCATSDLGTPRPFRVSDFGVVSDFLGTVLEMQNQAGMFVAWKKVEPDVFEKWRGRGRLPAGANADEYLGLIRDGCVTGQSTCHARHNA